MNGIAKVILLNVLVCVCPQSNFNFQGFAQSHNRSWGRLYRAEDVEIKWHVPSNEEISFALEILDQVIGPLLSNLETLFEIPVASRDNAWRNDVCRYVSLHSLGLLLLY